jgi:hypothetical protein
MYIGMVNGDAIWNDIRELLWGVKSHLRLSQSIKVFCFFPLPFFNFFYFLHLLLRAAVKKAKSKISTPLNSDKRNPG